MITRPSSNSAASRPVLRSVVDQPRFVVREEYFGGVIYDRAGVGSAGYLEWDQYKWLAAHSSGFEPPELNAQFEGEVAEMGLISDGEINYELWPAKGGLPTGMLRSPIRLYFEITRGCQETCTYCFNSSGPGKEFIDELSTDEALKIIDKLKSDGIPELRITGGEAMIRPDTPQLISHARSIGLAVSQNTNATYGPKVAEKVIDARPNLVIASMDGIDAPVHDLLRGPRHEAILRNIRMFRDADLKVRINMSLNRQTIEGDLIERSVRYLAEHGFEICLILLRPTGRASDEMVRDSFLFADKLHEFMGRIQSLRAELPSAKLQTSFDIISSREVKPSPDLDLNTCAAGIAGCNINSRGEFAACAFLAEMDRSYNWNNIRDTAYSVLPFWQHDPRLLEFRERSVAKAKGCLSCKYYLTRCQGTCIVQEYWRDLKPGRFDPYCLIEVEEYFEQHS